MARKKKEESKTTQLIVEKPRTIAISWEEISQFLPPEENFYIATWYGKDDEIIKRGYFKDRMTAENKRLDWIVESVNNGDKVTSHTNAVITTKECKFTIELAGKE